MTEGRSHCQRAEGMLEAFLEGELSPEEQRWLSAHLERCERCGEELWALRLGRQARELLAPPEGSEQAVAERREWVLAQIREPVSPPRRLRFVRRWRWLAASAAAMVLAVFLARRPTAPVVEQPTVIVEQEPEAPPTPGPDSSVAIAEAPAERTVTEVRFFWDGVQIVWFFDSHFKP